MNKSIIIISLLSLIVKVKSEICWANYSSSGNFTCCPEGTPTIYADKEGEWGFYSPGKGLEDVWCGIYREIDESCWVSGTGMTCCPEDMPVALIDQDGIWGQYENGEWCGFKGSEQRWNDRELVDETRAEWYDFKKKWDKEYKYYFERLAIFPGEDETKLNFGWYSTTKTTPSVLLSTNKDMSSPRQFNGTVEAHYELKGKMYYTNRVTVTGIKRNSVYYYKTLLNNKWQETVKFETHDPDNFNMIFYGDPQIGGSKNRYSIANKYTRVLTVDEGTRNDAFNWNRTITKSFSFAKKPSLILSAGDQTDEECNDLYDEQKAEIQLTNEETQYSAFLLPELIKTVPMACAIGNHDAHTDNFNNHFNLPNIVERERTNIVPGYSYFFKYNNVLILVLESNYNTCQDFEDAVNIAVAKYPDTDWRIAMFHHDIYGNGVTHSLEYFIRENLRPCMTHYLSDNQFDLVINGHDHVYTASKFVTYDTSDPTGEKVYRVKDIVKGKVNSDPKGTLYITANCATGSKLYTYFEDGPDYVSVNGQTFTSTFGILDFQKEENGKLKLTINSYDVETNKVTDGPYIIEKRKCWAKPLGFRCCSENNTEVYSSDESGDWGIEDDQWCGIIGSKTPGSSTTKPSISTTTTTTKTTTTTTTTKTTTTTTTTKSPEPTNCFVQAWQQCGGRDYHGSTCCADKSYYCKVTNEYYSQCVPLGS